MRRPGFKLDYYYLLFFLIRFKFDPITFGLKFFDLNPIRLGYGSTRPDSCKIIK
jgi:hypothetical protein